VSDDFEDALGDVLAADAKMTGDPPVAFLHGVIDESGTVGTLSPSQGGFLTYDQRLVVLAVLIAEVEADPEHSAEYVFRDLVTRRNAMRGSGDEE